MSHVCYGVGECIPGVSRSASMEQLAPSHSVYPWNVQVYRLQRNVSATRARVECEKYELCLWALCISDKAVGAVAVALAAMPVWRIKPCTTLVRCRWPPHITCTCITNYIYIMYNYILHADMRQKQQHKTQATETGRRGTRTKTESPERHLMRRQT